jgi:hypothetical protein
MQKLRDAGEYCLAAVWIAAILALGYGAIGVLGERALVMANLG